MKRSQERKRILSSQRLCFVCLFSTSIALQKYSQGNANQNHNEILIYTHQNGYKNQIINVGKDVEKLDPSCTASGNVKCCKTGGS